VIKDYRTAYLLIAHGMESGIKNEKKDFYHARKNKAKIF
jgi:hypothetical protein